MPKPELATADEAIFKIRFKKIKPDVYFYLDKGRLYSYSVKNKISKSCFSTAVHFKFASKQQRVCCFRQNDNIFQYNINEGSLIQLTNFRKGKRMRLLLKETFKDQEELFNL
jgi:hypothetical protein